MNNHRDEKDQSTCHVWLKYWVSFAIIFLKTNLFSVSTLLASQRVYTLGKNHTQVQYCYVQVINHQLMVHWPRNHPWRFWSIAGQTCQSKLWAARVFCMMRFLLLIQPIRLSFQKLRRKLDFLFTLNTIPAWFVLCSNLRNHENQCELHCIFSC